MTSALIVLVAAVGGLTAQQPTVQNGRVETRTATAIDRELATLGGGPDPVWIAWQVPMIDGDRNLCSSWSDGRTYVRGATLEPRGLGAEMPQFAAATGPARLEGGTGLIVLLRMIDGRLERLRMLGDDCPIDAGGRTFYWLTGIAPAESVRYLDTLTRQESLSTSGTRQIVESAIAAIALHRDQTATAVLDRLSSKTTDRSLRRQAAAALASGRGAYGFDRITALIKEEPDRDLRQAFVGALAQSPQPGAAPALLALARSDSQPAVRGEAAYHYVRRSGQAGLSTAVTLIDAEADDGVKRRIVSGIGTLPGPVSSPVLIDLARTNRNLVVRKEAVSALGRSKDPTAIAFLEELVVK
jgi:hypothetical protein